MCELLLLTRLCFLLLPSLQLGKHGHLHVSTYAYSCGRQSLTPTSFSFAPLPSSPRLVVVIATTSGRRRCEQMGPPHVPATWAQPASDPPEGPTCRDKFDQIPMLFHAIRCHVARAVLPQRLYIPLRPYLCDYTGFRVVSLLEHRSISLP